MQVVFLLVVPRHYSIAIIYKTFMTCQELYRRKCIVLHANYDTIWQKEVELLWISVWWTLEAVPTDTEGGTTVHLKNTPTEILLKDRMGPMEAIYEKILQACPSPLPLPDCYPWTRSIDSILELDINTSKTSEAILVFLRKNLHA